MGKATKKSPCFSAAPATEKALVYVIYIYVDKSGTNNALADEIVGNPKKKIWSVKEPENFS